MNRYLADSDSDYEDFKSVKSGDGNTLQVYEKKYRNILRDDDGKIKPKIKFDLHNRCKS